MFATWVSVGMLSCRFNVTGVDVRVGRAAYNGGAIGLNLIDHEAAAVSSKRITVSRRPTGAPGGVSVALA